MNGAISRRYPFLHFGPRVSEITRCEELTQLLLELVKRPREGMLQEPDKLSITSNRMFSRECLSQDQQVLGQDSGQSDPDMIQRQPCLEDLGSPYWR